MATTVNTPSAVCSGNNDMNSRYALTFAQVNELIAEMNTQTFFDNVALLYSTPIDNVISLWCFPFDVKNAISSAITDDNILINVIRMQTKGAYFGNIPAPKFDLGSLAITRKFNNFLDFAPYTKFEIYLPYIGFETLDTDIFMGNTVKIEYAVDLYSGKCTAYVSVVDSNNISTLIMIRDGQCGMPIQVAGGSGAEMSRNMLKFGIGAAAGAASLTAGAVASGASAAGGSAQSVAGTFGGAMGYLGSTTVGALNAGKQIIHKGGTTDANNAFYAPQNCYIVRTTPVVAEPTSYAHSYGRPSGKTETLSTLTGYTQVDAVHVEGSDFGTATHEERAEIERLLKSGVIL